MAKIKKIMEIKRPQKLENYKRSERSLEDEIREVKNESAEYVSEAADLSETNEDANIKKKEGPVPVRKSIEDIFQRGSQISGAQRENKTSLAAKIIMVFLLLALLALAGYGVWGYMENQKTKKAQEKISLSSAIKEASETDKDKLREDNEVKKDDVSEKEAETEKSPSEIKISVLNGGSAAGSAGKVKTLLAAAGYTKVEAGNADKSDNLGVKIYFSEELAKEAEKLLVLMKKQYPSAITQVSNTVEEKSAEIVVILGK